MSKKKEPKEKIDYSFDLDGKTTPSPDSEKDLEAEVIELEKKVYTLEKIIRENNLANLLTQPMSDEEYICAKGIESIKKLVMNEIQTKDDINIFDVLYRNLCTIRGIKVEKKPKEKPKTQAELYGLITGGKV